MMGRENDESEGTFMATLYLMRHGQTELNLAGLVQGHSDSPLTELGERQAHVAGRWLAGLGVPFERMCVSPLGRTRATLAVVREELAAVRPDIGLPPVEVVDGLMERCYGEFERCPSAEVPADVWDPGEALVPFGGEGSAALRERVVSTLCQIMKGAGDGNVLAVSHGSISLQFKLANAAHARCDQDVPLSNCCVLVYDYDPATGIFTNTQIVNHEFE